MKFLGFFVKLGIAAGATFALFKFLENYLDKYPTAYVVDENFDIEN